MRLFRVDRYGWTWLATDPFRTKKALLVAEWTKGNATELIVPVPGRRNVTI